MEDDTQWKMTFNGKKPHMEEDLRRKKTSYERQPSIEDYLKLNLEVEYLSNHCRDFNLWRLEENSEDILSVALLSSACYTNQNSKKQIGRKEK